MKTCDLVKQLPLIPLPVMPVPYHGALNAYNKLQVEVYATTALTEYRDFISRALEGAPQANIYFSSNLHANTAKLVADLASDLAAKLLSAQIKHNLANGWDNLPEGVDPNDGRYFMTEEQCNKALRNHLDKGDILDCVAYLAFMRVKGWKVNV